MMAASQHRPYALTDDRRIALESDETGGLLFDVLGDADCRSILEATSGVACSATELSEACDIPLSTTYRKLVRLVDAGLLSEGVRLRRSGRHTTEYVRCVDDVHVSMNDFQLVLASNGAEAGSVEHAW